MDNKIKTIAIDYYKVPLEGNLVDALHGKHDNFELITATVTLGKRENRGVVIHIQEDLAEQQSLRCWSRISPRS